MKRKRIKKVVAELVLATDNYTPENLFRKKLQVCAKNNTFVEQKNNKNEYTEKIQENFKRN
jgi:hypothetical protein